MDQINRKRKNRVRWTVDAEKLLLLHWGDSKELPNAKRNLHIFARLEKEFSKRQMNYSAAEIKEKVHNFTNRYKLEKNAVGMTGGSPSSWIHYKEVEEILSGNKAANFKELMQETRRLRSLQKEGI